MILVLVLSRVRFPTASGWITASVSSCEGPEHGRLDRPPLGADDPRVAHAASDLVEAEVSRLTLTTDPSGSVGHAFGGVCRSSSGGASNVERRTREDRTVRGHHQPRQLRWPRRANGAPRVLGRGPATRTSRSEAHSREGEPVRRVDEVPRRLIRLLVSRSLGPAHHQLSRARLGAPAARAAARATLDVPAVVCGFPCGLRCA